jgi:hypothetical protein
MNMFKKGGNSMKKNTKYAIVLFSVFLSIGPLLAISQEPNISPVFKPEEIEQLVAPIALYPDSLISQILMASTYPLEVIQAQRWVEKNNNISGDALAIALEKETWDPSVKSLVNFPQILTMMNEKLDWMQKLGDVFLAQQKDVMDTVQKLRKKAQEQGNLKTTEEQVVKVEQEVIIIESSQPQVIYVPVYDPVVIYGTWPYPAYPPYYYYPPGYSYRVTPYSFVAGVAVGVAWGYAWGGCNWHGGDIDIDINRNININQKINRNLYIQNYQNQGQLDKSGKMGWQHNPEHRKGVAYTDQMTAQKYNRASTSEAIKSREAFRGRDEQGRQELAGGGVDTIKGSPQTIQRAQSATIGTTGTSNISNNAVSYRSSAFQDIDRGSSVQNLSSRGQASRQSMPSLSGTGGVRLRR